MSKQDLIAAIESRLDTIEGLLDELEDNQVKVEPFTDLCSIFLYLYKYVSHFIKSELLLLVWNKKCYL